MTKKRNRDRVIAEVTLFHLMRLANEQGCSVSHERVMAFLNEEERAQEMWNHMMQAGLEYVAYNLFPQWISAQQ